MNIFFVMFRKNMVLEANLRMVGSFLHIELFQQTKFFIKNVLLKRVGYDCGFLSARTKWSGHGIGGKLTFVVTMHECYEIY